MDNNNVCEGCDRPYNGLKDSKGNDYCPCSEPDCNWPVHEHGEEHYGGNDAYFAAFDSGYISGGSYSL
jgi:hypothetical protein